jgi:amidase
MTTPPWQDIASKKRESILAAIPSEWRIEKLPSVEEQVDVTDYIKQYLNEKELEVTESSADVIAKTVAEEKWTAEEVARAFCHRAALAHQLVCLSFLSCEHLLNQTSSIVYTKSSSTPLSKMPKLSMRISVNMEKRKDHSTVYPSR